MPTIHSRAKRFDGSAIDYVLIFDWQSGKQLAKIVPDVNGNWSFSFDQNLRVGITYIADGCEPITRGAYDFVISPI